MTTALRIWEQINPNNTPSVFCLQGISYRRRLPMKLGGWKWIRSFDGTPGCYITHDREEAKNAASALGLRLEVYDPQEATHD